MENKHTQGKWQVTQKNNVSIISHSYILQSVWKCEIINQFAAKNQKADAQLIAAAPELLGALIAAKEQFLNFRYEDLTEPAKQVYDMVNNAILKATQE